MWRGKAPIVVWIGPTTLWLFLMVTLHVGICSTQVPKLPGKDSRIRDLMGLVRSQLEQKQTEAARRSLQELSGLLVPEDPRFFQVASLFAAHEDFATAIPLLERSRIAFPHSYDVSFNLSLAYFRNQNYRKAAETLIALVRQKPRAEAYNLLGVVQEQRKQYLDAVRAFQKAAELEPGNEDYRYDYGFELLKHKTEPAAIAIFASGVQDFPRSVKLHMGLGCAYYVVGKHEEAAHILLEAIKLEPREKLAYLLLGKTYEQAGPLQPTIADAFRAYLDRRPHDPWAYYHYGNILYLVAQSAQPPDFQTAKSFFQQALSLNPSFAEACVQLAAILQTEGQNEESLSFLHRAVRSNPKLAVAHYRLGLAYRRLGEKEKAAAAFALSEKLNAENEANRNKEEIIQFLIGPGK
ncbi:MAG: tetratricopeptide repeat protein [Acidobacteriota bacterium]